MELKKKGEMMTYRPDIKIVDCTLRDGGLVNNFYFTDEFVKDLYLANLKAGVDYMEMGYKASKEIFDVKEFGKWKFSDEQHIREVVGDNDTRMKLSVMLDVGRTNMADIPLKSESVVDLTRIACYIHQIPSAIEMIEECNQKGYETTVNVMAVSTAKDDDIDVALDLLGQSSVGTIYLVDSYGSLYPEEIRKLADKYLNMGEKYAKRIGIHAHNNQQLAFANTIEVASMGVSYLDATVSGLGRGAGNCTTELLMGFLKNPRYDVTPILQFVEKHILELRKQGVVWGYDVPYALTGRLNQHPRAAIKFISDKRTDYAQFYHGLTDQE